jgi:hypothetical protein
LRGSDYGYECYIDYKKGVPSQGCWASQLTPLSSLIIGIKEYKSRNI